MNTRAPRWHESGVAAVVAMISTACSGASSLGEHDLARVDLKMSAWSPTTLSMSSAGEAPWAAVRIGAPSSSGGTVTEEVRWETRFETSAARGAVISEPMVVLQQRTFAISASGVDPIAYDFEVVSASDEARGGGPLDPAVATALQGRRGRWRANALCHVVDAGIATDGGPADRHLPGLLRTAVELCPLLPEEPVGLGAQWTSTQARSDGSTVSTEWVLVQRHEGRDVLTFTATSDSGGAQTLGEGRLEIDPSRSVPVRFDARGRTTRVLEEQEPTGGRTSVTWTTTWTMHAKAFPSEG